MSAPRSRLLVALVLGAVAAVGCNDVLGRRKAQEGNRLYRDGHYKESVAAFEEAAKLAPNFPTLWLNKGFACRQMLIPGAKSAESTAAAKCALDAFKRFQELAPDDQRGELLYIQTLFDSDDYETLVKIYEERARKSPSDLDTVNGLIQVYAKWNKIEDALGWYEKKAELKKTDPEAQYAVGVFIWQQLMLKGGGPDKAGFDPRPDPNKPKDVKVPPAFNYGDIISQQRIDYADKGIAFLQKAVDLRPKYPEALAYINLLFRQRSFALFDQPEEWQKSIDQAEAWRKKTLEMMGKAVTPSGAPGAAAAGASEGGAAAAGAGQGAPAPGEAGVAAVAPGGEGAAPDKPEAQAGKGQKGRRR